MRIVLADLKSAEGFVSKDTVAGGYGSRLRPFSKVTSVICRMKRRLHDVPSVHMAYLAAMATRAGHEVVTTDGALVDGDVAVVLSSLVDHRQETAWAARMRARGVPVGFAGLAASKMSGLFEPHADFVINGEPEAAFARLVAGEPLSGLVPSPAIDDLDSLPFPQWDTLARKRRRVALPFAARPFGGLFPLLASRGCPEFCTYCPHRILAGHRMRSVGNIADELQELCARYPRPYIVFRDPLFTENRERALALAHEIRSRRLSLRFECETRLDRLDDGLLDALHRAGLRAISFGVEAVSTATLKRVGRRPIPEVHQRAIIDHCRSRGIVTAAFYVIGFLQDDWDSIAATIDFAVALRTTVAQFKILTPYPGTPMWKQLGPLVFEEDWQRFDGFTPTFNHPNLTPDELRFLLGAAYTRFYMRPSYLADYCQMRAAWIRSLTSRLDARVFAHHTRTELAQMSRSVSC